jgi:hypothetical protein
MLAPAGGRNTTLTATLWPETRLSETGATDTHVAAVFGPTEVHGTAKVDSVKVAAPSGKPPSIADALICPGVRSTVWVTGLGASDDRGQALDIRTEVSDSTTTP